jgi:hypothetical protein
MFFVTGLGMSNIITGTNATQTNVYFKNLFPLFLPCMFRALISPSSEVPQAVFYIQPFGSCGVYVAHLRVPVDWFVWVVLFLWLCVWPWSGLSWWFHCSGAVVVLLY